jgi:hypothetical protein
MAGIAKTNVEIGVDAVGLDGDLKKVENRLGGFAGKATRDLNGIGNNLGDLDTKFSRRFGKSLVGGSVFKQLGSEADAATKAVGTLEIGVGALESVIGKAMRKMGALSALGFGAGIGALVFGVGWAAGKIGEASARTAAATPTMDEGTKKMLERAVGGEVTALPGGGARVGGFWSGWTADFDAMAVRGATASATLGDMTRTMSEFAAAGGRSRETMAILATAAGVRATRDIAVSGATPEIRGIHTSLLEAMITPFRDAVTAHTTEAGVRSVMGIDSSGRGTRDAAATFGMSEEAAERYRLSLRRVTETIGGITIETTRSLSPMEEYERRWAEIRDMETRTGVEMPAARAAARRSMEAETAILARHAEAWEVLRERRGVAMAEAEHGRLADMGRNLQAAMMTPLQRTDDQIANFRTMFDEGVIGATTMRRALLNLAGDTASPLEALGMRIEGTARVRAAALASGMDAAGLARIDAAGASALLGFAAGVRMDLPPGVEAANFGSVEAMRAINAANRAGPTDPVDRVREAIEISRRVEEETRDATRAVATALREGRIVVPAAGL